MSRETVFFSNTLGARVRQDFDRSYLKLGREVFATLGAHGEVINVGMRPHAGSQSLWVSWIAPSEWYVELSGRFVAPNDFITRVAEELKAYASEDDVRAGIARFEEQIRPEFQHTTREWERNPLAVIFTVLERLDLVEKINHEAVRDQLSPLHYEELASYLMLTCFDRLGQPADWMDFGSWLEDKTKGAERAVALEQCPGLDPVAATRGLHQHYTRIYGAKNSFYRFVETMIPEDVRDNLFASIDIEKLTNPPTIKTLPTAQNDEKLKYLFKRRNDYTHKAAFCPPCGPWLLRSKSNVVQDFKTDHWITTRVHDWPDVLERTVRSGLAYYLGCHNER